MAVAVVITLLAMPPPARASPTTMLADAGTALEVPVVRVDRPAELRTRHAIFRGANFGSLPGWDADDLITGWSAFRNTCLVLQRRATWRGLCEAARAVTAEPRAIRRFFEAGFTPVQILNTDASDKGEVTGYFEPLLEGRRQRDSRFSVPVLGVPRDLYALDWTTVPKARREGTIAVRPKGYELVVSSAAGPDTFSLDLSRFTLDTRDRRLRVRLSIGEAGRRAEPYHARAELEALRASGRLDAPVLAWVADALGYYAMQIQGAGRIRLENGELLRVQFAEQNGHPFRPVRVVAKAGSGVRTRGVGVGSDPADEFEFDNGPGSVSVPPVAYEQAASDVPLTRGIGTRAVRAPEQNQGSRAAAVDDVIEALLGTKPKAPTAQAGPADRSQLPAARARSAEVPKAYEHVPAIAKEAPASAGLMARLATDPSFVFFSVSSDQSSKAGPPGALGVPLTPGRSIAIDPRVTPLGYPVFLAAVPTAESSNEMRRLVLAQDTGGAIRGAVRADYFWGFGSGAGENARSTRYRGQMWVLLPNSEAQALLGGGVVTRGLPGQGSQAKECLVADEEFCAEVD